MIEPVRITGDGADGTVRVTNMYDFADLSALVFSWSYQVDGETVESGALTVPSLAPGESADVKMPEPPAESDGTESHWTVRASLAADTAWGPAGHVVGWGQFPVTARPLPSVSALAGPVPGERRITLGPATFDARTGELRTIGAVDVTGLRLDVWRAPTDNDDGASWQTDTRFGLLWRTFGLHRMRHRLDGVELSEDALTVRTRVAPAAREIGLATVYRWTSDGTRLRLTVSVAPEGNWAFPLPRLGIRFGLDPSVDRVRWFGGGPGEGYPDTKSASLLGRWESTIEGLQTPTSVRRRTAPALTSVGRRWAGCGSTVIRSSGSPPAAGRRSSWTRPPTAPISPPATLCG